MQTELTSKVSFTADGCVVINIHVEGVCTSMVEFNRENSLRLAATILKLQGYAPPEKKP